MVEAYKQLEQLVSGSLSRSSPEFKTTQNALQMHWTTYGLKGLAKSGMVSMQAPLQAPHVMGKESMLTDIWETPQVLRRLLPLGIIKNGHEQ